jgi:hypothetical protein
MNSQYAKWTELTGAAPVVEADGPVLAARHIADAHGWQIIRNPETFEYRLAPKYEGVQIPQLPSVIEQLATRDVGQGLSITDAHNLRVKLHEQMRGMAGAGNMTPGPKWHELRQVDNALNSSFSALENESGPMGQAARGLAATNKQYAEGIRQFSSDLIRKVAGDAAQGRPANPEVIADVLLSEGRNAQTRQILRLLPDETKKEVRRAYMNGMFREADILDPVTGERVFSGSSLLRGLDADRREAMRAAGFSEREISGLRRFAQWAHANKITMNAEEMAALERATAAVGPTEPGKIQDILKSIIGRKLVYRRFVESDPTSAVLNMSNPQLRDEVVNYLIVPGKTARLEEAARVLGTNSPEWQEIQRVATLKLLQGVMDETTAGTPKIIADRLQSNLNAFTPKQKELLFPNHLDDDLIRLMRDTRFMFPEGRKTEFGVSLAAASVLLHAGLPFSSHAIKADIAVGTSLLASWIMTRQPLMRFLALESSQNPTVARNLSAALRMMALEDMTAGPGRRRAARPDLWNLPPDRHE